MITITQWRPTGWASVQQLKGSPWNIGLYEHIGPVKVYISPLEASGMSMRTTAQWKLMGKAWAQQPIGSSWVKQEHNSPVEAHGSSMCATVQWKLMSTTAHWKLMDQGRQAWAQQPSGSLRCQHEVSGPSKITDNRLKPMDKALIPPCCAVGPTKCLETLIPNIAFHFQYCLIAWQFWIVVVQELIWILKQVC